MPVHGMRLGVEAERPVLDGVAGVAVVAPNDGQDAGSQLFHIKRFADIVVRAFL